MSSNIIVVDIGNSYIKIAIVNNNLSVLNKLMFKTNKNLTVHKIIKKLKELNNNYEIHGSIIGSVVGNITNKFYRGIKKLYKINPFLIDQETVKLNFVFKLPNKNTIGQDLLALCEYCSLENKNSIAFSFGTAIFAVLLINNEFVGASISPGIGVSFDFFMKRAHMIKNFSLNKKELNFYGDNTLTALESGVNNIRSGFVNNFYYQSKKMVGSNNLTCVISGGEGSEIISDFKYKLDENAIIVGFAHIYFINNTN